MSSTDGNDDHQHRGATEPAPSDMARRRLARHVRRAVAAGAVALSLSIPLVAVSGVVEAAEPAGGPAPAYEGTIGGSPYGEMTVEVSPPTFSWVLCHSDWDQVNVYVAPGTVGTFWTDVQYLNTATGETIHPGWVATTIRADAGVVGADPARWLTGAVGTWLVHLRLGYHDASGQFLTTYDQWVPNYANMLPGQVYLPWATPGATCIVE